MYWGEKVEIGKTDVRVAWHEPNADEVVFAEKILEKFFNLAFASLEKHMASDSASDPDFLKYVSLLYNCVHSLSPLIHPKRSMSHEDKTDILRLHSMKYRKFPLKSCQFAPETIEKWNLMSNRTEAFLLKLHHYIIAKLPNNVEAMIALVKIVRVHLCYEGLMYINADFIPLTMCRSQITINSIKRSLEAGGKSIRCQECLK
jgi:Proteasome-substrate-size regulator, mid region